MSGHKTIVNKFKRTEIILSIFFHHSGMKLEVNYMKKTGKYTNMWKLNIMLLPNKWGIKRENIA